MMRLIRAFAALRGERCCGSYIARARWQARPGYEKAMGETQLSVERETKTFLQLTAALQCGQEQIAALSIALFLHPAATKKKRVPAVGGTLWRSFVASEICRFTALAQDENPIHQGRQPIVPGLLMLREFIAKTGASTCEMRFIRPLRAGLPVNLEALPDGIWRGFDAQGQIFQAICKE